MYTRLNFTQTKGRRLFKCGGVCAEGRVQKDVGREGLVSMIMPSVLVNSHLSKKGKQSSHILTSGGSFAYWNMVSIQVKLSPPQKLRNRETISLDVYISERWSPGLLGYIVWE